jgi:hypothetical protein
MRWLLGQSCSGDAIGKQRQLAAAAAAAEALVMQGREDERTQGGL